MKQASIVIPTKDKLSRLRLVLKALESQVDDTVEVIVVFDGCSKKVLEDFSLLKLAYTPIVIIHEQNVGRAKARNSGILKATGEIIIFLDDDRIPCPNYIAKHVACHQKGRYAVIGERVNVNYPEKTLDEIFNNGFTESDYHKIQKDSVHEPLIFIKKTARFILGQRIESVTFSTGNSSSRRQDLLKISMFDENYKGWGLEDVDLGYRLSKIGVKIKRDYSIVNYHLSHLVNADQKRKENRQNIEYFTSKFKGDKTAIFMAKLGGLF